ncbi:tetratricopeptide repeat protein [Gemmata sp. JC717]|uniref:tetratricopeptide repeat protein n=1 Tax=Gemmata algarum TaxID=2975278 RepID=UPI0021BB6D18|nr:tetratricopeptide repeat protein [Gemmata algarum]MDY3553158.1 tetratricopeptide repeat protein [Gemmata algarum]
MRGNYAEALAGYDDLARSEKLPLAFLGQSACLRAQGEYAKARDALDTGLKAHPGHPDLLAARADLLFAQGKWDDATHDANDALKKDGDHFLARWVRARVLRDGGDLSGADTEMRWFVKAYTDAAAAGKEITDPDKLLIVAQAGIENATTHAKHEQFKFILQDLLRDALKPDADFWPAEHLSGQLLLSKHNRAEAANAFDAALKINPKAVEALVGKGAIALERMVYAEAERHAGLALKVNPYHPAALRLKADVRLAEADPAGAEQLLRTARAINPRDAVTLARFAALKHLAGDRPAATAFEKEVAAFDAKPATFYLELGNILSDARQFPIAAECFERASVLRPALPGPKAGLGLLLYTQGREPEAMAALKAAMKADPFNVRVDNALKVLEELAGYATTETKHFVIRFDQKNDHVLAAFLADVLESTHAELAKQYGFEPPEKVLVEVFARRQIFSGRIAMLPGLPGAVQGACTGPLIALPSPRADGGARAYNWAVVVRHELTHAFNLLQTEHRAPVWLTEGLAVRAENTKRFGQVAPLLRDRLAAGTVFDLDTISRAYKRFNQPADVMLAYYQGLLYVEWITKSHGERGVAKLLDAFKTGAGTDTALKTALGVERPAFEAGYRKFLGEVVRETAPRRPDAPMAFAELEAAHKKAPGDPDLAARLAGEYLRRDRANDAKALVEAVRANEKGHPGAAVVLARILKRAKDDAGARAVLEDAAGAHPGDSRVLLELGKLHFEQKDYDRAAARYEQGRTAAPGEADWLDQLARVYEVAKKPDQLAAVLAEQTVVNPDDIQLCLRLAKLHANANRPADAERFALRALHIDVLNADAKQLLYAALESQKKIQELDALRKRYQ